MPGSPSAKTAIDKKKKVFKASIRPEPGVSYSISGNLKGSKKAKRGSCATDRKTKNVVCSLKLKKGVWSISVTPSRGGVTGTPLVRSVKVR